MAGSKTTLIQSFDMLSQLNAELIDELQNYAETNNAFDVHFMQGYTFGSGTALLHQIRGIIITEENRTAILNADPRSKEILVLTGHIQDQIKFHDQIQLALRVFFKGKN